MVKRAFILFFCFLLVCVFGTAFAEENSIDYYKEFSEMTLEELESINATLSAILNEKRIGNAKLTFDQPEIEIQKGKNVKLTVSSTGRDITQKTVITYESDNENIATVHNGMLQGVAAGTTTIKATAVFEDEAVLETRANVKVVVPVASLRASQQMAVFVGEEVNLADSITIMPEDATERGLLFSINDDSVATVDEHGILKGIKGGKAIVTITSAEQSSVPKTVKCNITVNQAVSSIELSETEINVGKQKTQKIEARVFPEDASNLNLDWTTEDSKIATVSNAGIITGISGGSTYIVCTAKDGSNVSARIKVNVITAVNAIKFDGTTKDIIEGQTRATKVSVLPEDATNPKIVWFSNDTNIATVDQQGNIKGISSGICTVTAKAEDGSGTSASITVYVEPVNPAIIEEIQWSTNFGVKTGKMRVIATSYCNHLKIKSFEYDVECISMYGTGTQGETLTYNGETIQPGKKGKSKLSKYTVSGFTSASQVSITITSVTFSDGTVYVIPEKARFTSHFGM